MVGGILAVFPLLRQIRLPAPLAALVALRRVQLLREGGELQKFLAALAPLEVDLSIGVLPGGLVAVLADVFVLTGNDAVLPGRQPAHYTTHVVLVLGAREVDQFFVHWRLFLRQGGVRGDVGDAVRLVFVQRLPRGGQAGPAFVGAYPIAGGTHTALVVRVQYGRHWRRGGLDIPPRRTARGGKR
jgi:hypothetical protein